MPIDAHSHIDKYEETLELALEEIRKYKIFSMLPINYIMTLLRHQTTRGTDH
jgi:hypothetical protein